LCFLNQVHANSAFDFFPEGEQTVLKEKSKGECPDINFVHKEFKDGSKILMLSPRLVFDLRLLTKEQDEKVPDGCHYKSSLKFQDKSLVKLTSRFDCPKPSENGIQKEILEKTNKGLHFKSSLNGKTVFDCNYVKGGK
jgi:hypothetical protein